MLTGYLSAMAPQPINVSLTRQTPGFFFSMNVEFTVHSTLYC